MVASSLNVRLPLEVELSSEYETNISVLGWTATLELINEPSSSTANVVLFAAKLKANTVTVSDVCPPSPEQERPKLLLPAPDTVTVSFPEFDFIPLQAPVALHVLEFETDHVISTSSPIFTSRLLAAIVIIGSGNAAEPPPPPPPQLKRNKNAINKLDLDFIYIVIFLHCSI